MAIMFQRAENRKYAVRAFDLDLPMFWSCFDVSELLLFYFFLKKGGWYKRSESLVCCIYIDRTATDTSSLFMSSATSVTFSTMHFFVSNQQVTGNSFWYRNNCLSNLTALPVTEKRIRTWIKKSKSFYPAVMVVSLDVPFQNMVIQFYERKRHVKKQVNPNDKWDISC